MSGTIVLEGGSEFGGRMSLPDLRSIELAGGMDVPVVIIPTAAAPDNNHQRAGGNGKRWFQGLGARNVQVLPLIDEASANDPAILRAIEEARLIYLLGGFPHYLGQTLLGSQAWVAMQLAHAKGAVISGSSAGAMVLCEHYYNPSAGEVVGGLGLVPNVCVMPHFNANGRRWAEALRGHLPHATLVGIDEQTGMIDEGSGAWGVLGAGSITLYRPKHATVAAAEVYIAGVSFVLSAE